MTLRSTNTFLIVIMALAACRSDRVPERVAGDAAEEVATIPADDLPAHARALLESGRPWRAAMVMRRYLSEDSAPTPDHLVLAARAEAGWDAWQEVRVLLSAIPDVATHGNGIALYLSGRALDEAGDAARAVTGYRAFMARATDGDLERERAAARLRLGLALIRVGDHDAARRELRSFTKPMDTLLCVSVSGHLNSPCPSP
jgi:hypothetical protein